MVRVLSLHYKFGLRKMGLDHVLVTSGKGFGDSNQYIKGP